jgi:hypothetical protein
MKPVAAARLHVNPPTFQALARPSAVSERQTPQQLAAALSAGKVCVVTALHSAICSKVALEDKRQERSLGRSPEKEYLAQPRYQRVNLLGTWELGRGLAVARTCLDVNQ